MSATDFCTVVGIFQVGISVAMTMVYFTWFVVRLIWLYGQELKDFMEFKRQKYLYRDLLQQLSEDSQELVHGIEAGRRFGGG